MVPGSLAILSASFDETRRGKAIGTWSGFGSITAAVGPLLGGWLIDHASWRWVFFLNLPLAVAVIAISLRCGAGEPGRAGRGEDRRSRRAPRHPGLGGLTFGLIQSSALGWGNPW